MGAIELLDEMRVLLNIPLFEQLMFHKLHELKDYFEEETSFLIEARRKFQKSVYRAMEICSDEDKKENFQAYFFETVRLASEKWRTTVEPLPPPGYDIHDVIPDDIINYMNSITPSTRDTHTEEKFSCPGLKHITFDLKFIKYSDEYIMGSITPRKIFTGRATTRPSEPDPENDGKIYQYAQSSHGDESNYRELLYFMKAYPDLKAYIFTELQMRLKPMVLGNLVELTVTAPPGGQS